jgi:hypothetical protein
MAMGAALSDPKQFKLQTKRKDSAQQKHVSMTGIIESKVKPILLLDRNARLAFVEQQVCETRTRVSAGHRSIGSQSARGEVGNSTSAEIAADKLLHRNVTDCLETAEAAAL